MLTIVIAEAVAILLLGILVAGLLRSHAEILRSLHGLGVDLDPDRLDPAVPAPRVGAVHGGAPEIVGVRPNGDPLKVTTAGRHTTLLAFLSTGCATCSRFWSAFNDGPPADLPAGTTRLVVVTKGLEAESPSRLQDLAPDGIVTVASTAAWQEYGVPVSPYFILVDNGSVIGEGAAASWPQVASLLNQSVRDGKAAHRRAIRSGTERHQDVDEQLAAAGITSGHPSLYPPAHTS